MSKIIAIEYADSKGKGQGKVFEDYPELLVPLVSVLDERFVDWGEFYLLNRPKQPSACFVRIDRHFTVVPKSRVVADLLVWLDKSYPAWHRLHVEERYYEKLSYDDCEVGMLLRQGSTKGRPGSNATNKLRLVLGMTERYIEVKEEYVVNPIKYDLNKRKAGSFAMELLCKNFDAKSFEEVFG